MNSSVFRSNQNLSFFNFLLFFSDDLFNVNFLKIGDYPLPIVVDGLLSKLDGLGSQVGNLLLDLGLIGEETDEDWCDSL